jgi:hypothetical protein
LGVNQQESISPPKVITDILDEDEIIVEGGNFITEQAYRQRDGAPQTDSAFNGHFQVDEDQFDEDDEEFKGGRQNT